MVDISTKDNTLRIAKARAILSMRSETHDTITEGEVKKGDVFAVARVAAIQAAKRTSDLIPLCHPLPLNYVKVAFEWLASDQLAIDTEVSVDGKTGVEMEALCSASVAALTIYDMCKAIDRGMEIVSVKLIEKRGGKSGHWIAQ